MKNLTLTGETRTKPHARFKTSLPGLCVALSEKLLLQDPNSQHFANSCVPLRLLLQPHLDEMFYGLRQQNSETEGAFTQQIPPAPLSGHQFNLEHLTAEAHTQNDPPFSANHFNIKISYPPQASYTRLSLPGLGLKSTIVPLEHL